MPYNPRVSHKYGGYAAQGYEQAGDFMARGTLGAAEATASGIRARGAGIASGIESAGSSIASGIQQAGSIWAENQAKMNQSTGQIEAWDQMGLVTPEQKDAFAKIRNPDKLAGAVSVYREQIQQDMITRRQEQARMSQFAYDRIAKAQDDAERSTRMPRIVKATDPITGQPISMMDTGAQWVPLKTPDADKAVTGITKEQVAPGEWMYKDQSGQVIPPSMVRQDKDYYAPMPDPEIERLKKRKAKLEGNIAAGNVRPGPDWDPLGASKLFVTPFKEQLAGVNAELGVLEKGAGVTGGGQIAAGGDYKSVEDVIADLKSKGGKLNREEAIKILQTKFGLQ